MTECKDCRETDCQAIRRAASLNEQKKLKRRCQASSFPKPKDPLAEVVSKFGVNQSLVEEILSGEKNSPDRKRISVLRRSLSRLLRQPDSKQLFTNLDPAWFKNGKLDLALARRMQKNPEDYL